jgi:LacI family transcriptional regulator
MPRHYPAKAVRAATLADVGRAAGTSAMAASAVLNGARTSSRIAEETRLRILKAAKKLRYRPNAAARALVNRRMNTIGVAAVIGEGDINSYALEIVTGILEEAARRGQNTTMFTLHDWDQDTERLHGWCDGRIDGMILIAPTLTREAAKLLPNHTPFVALHANYTFSNVINIESDEERGAYDMVRHLIAQGHRRILHITGNPGLIGAERRITGYQHALRSARIAAEKSWILPATFTTGGGLEAMRKWLREHEGEPLPDAVFCANDGIAIGCLEALAEAGLRVPEDISVAGFDDTLAARTTVPQLTTIRQPLRDMAHRAVEVLLDIIDQNRGRPAKALKSPIIFPVEVIQRNSVGPIPSTAPVAPKLQSMTV